MRELRSLAAAACLALLALHAHAAGTTAGSLIRNVATVDYTYGGVAASQQAAAIPVVVAQTLSVRTTWQDATPTAANSPDVMRPLSFAVTNTGNGTDTFTLTRNNAVPGGQFEPIDSPQGAIWLESGAQPGLQVSGPNADVLYIPGSNDLVLPPDASRIVYLASSMPAGMATGAAGKTQLQARSTAAPANAVAGQQVGVQNGVQVVVGAGSAHSVATGSYLVTSVAVGIVKSVARVTDPQGGTRVMPGAVITYRLTVSAGGTGTATNVVVTDPLPPALAYVPGSITVDGTARTDASDGDDSSFSGGTVRTVLPSISTPQSRVIEFKATVN